MSRKIKALIFLYILVSFISPNLSFAEATSTILSSCIEIREEGDYILSNDLAVSPNTSCINIHDTKNVNFDCQNYSITNTIDDIGKLYVNNIKVNNVSNFTIKNCRLNSNVISTSVASVPFLKNDGTPLGA